MCVKTQTQQLCSVSQLIFKYWGILQRETGIKQKGFAVKVREHYESTIAPQSRTIDWSRAPNIDDRMTRDGQQLFRWLTEDGDPSVNLQESIIAAFPPNLRFRLQIELASRQGMLVIPMPTGNPSEDCVFLGKIAKETGEAIVAISQLLEDGAIDSRDKDKAPAAIAELNEAIAVMSAMKAIIERKALGKPFFIMGVDLMAPPKADPTKTD